MLTNGKEPRTDAYDFSHDKLREQAYAVLSSARRRLLHRRVLDALQATMAPAAQLAYHALHAELMDLAFRYSVAAGDDAMRLGDFRNAIVHYEQAQRMLAKQSGGQDQQTSLPTMDIRYFYVQLGRAYELINEHGKAHSIDVMATAIEQFVV